MTSTRLPQFTISQLIKRFRAISLQSDIQRVQRWINLTSHYVNGYLGKCGKQAKSKSNISLFIFLLLRFDLYMSIQWDRKLASRTHGMSFHKHVVVMKY